MGGFILKGRVGGQLAITRSFGDHSLKEEGVIVDPYTKRINNIINDTWIVIASDGIWDVIEDN